MADTTSTSTGGATVKELINGLSGKFDAYALAQAAQNASFQSQISDLRVGLESHKAGEGHDAQLRELALLRQSVDNLATSSAEQRGERRGSERVWKIVYTLMSLPGVGAIVALILNTPK